MKAGDIVYIREKGVIIEVELVIEVSGGFLVKYDGDKGRSAHRSELFEFYEDAEESL